MVNDRVVVLGGYGAVGRVIAEVLLSQTPVDVVIAGRDADRAEEVVSRLRAWWPDGRVRACHADASDPASLSAAFTGARLVVVTTTTPDLLATIARAAIDAGADYMDILVSDSSAADLEPLAAEAVATGRVMVTQAGFHPGLPSVLIRRVAGRFDAIEAARVGMAMNARFERPEQVAELFPLIADFSADICVHGTWRKATYRDGITMQMGPVFGKAKLLPMPMPEIRATQAEFGLRDVAVYVSGFNWFVDNVVIPLIMVTQKIKRGSMVGPLSRLFVWGVNRFSPADDSVAMVTQASGTDAGRPRHVRLVVEHDNTYEFTAIPVVACVKQLLDGALPAGLGMMGHLVEPERLLRDMESMGVLVRWEP